MIKSMTGYGKAECQLKDRKVTIEIKSLNSKNLDIYTKIPGLYREKELEIRNSISKKLQRGKVEFVLYYEVTDDKKATTINSDVVKNYYNQLKNVALDLDLQTSEQLLQMAIRMPDTLSTERDQIDQEDWKEIHKAALEAMDQLNDFRLQEGEYLQKDIVQRIKKIEKCKEEITPFELERTEKIRTKLTESLNSLNTDQEIDKNRFEQELIYYLEKLDITEEKVRLTNHCNYFIEIINEPESNGKKLGFITQEIGREINTIGSKANNSEMQKFVVLMKDELEKIKEQMLNIL
ncbi:MAG: YicC family protein [Bacteroidales bacterium]|nr:YicC family protein [Bacteroidales bacterium]